MSKYDWENIKVVVDSIKHLEDLAGWGGTWRKYGQGKERMKEAFPAIYKDYLWTLNLPYVESIALAVMAAAHLAEEKLIMDFGGFYPMSNEIGLYQVKNGDLKEGKYPETYVLDVNEVLVLTGFAATGANPTDFVYGNLDPGSRKLGPISMYDMLGPHKLCLFNVPIIIEPRSSVCFRSSVYRIGEEGYKPLGGVGTLRGYWLSSVAGMLERRKGS